MRSSNRTNLIRVAWCAALAAGLAGCQTPRDLFADPQADIPHATDAARSSRVFDAPRLAQLAEHAAPAPALPWYVDRQDRPPSVAAGVQSATFERSVVRRVDRQRSFRGRVFDHFHETTRQWHVTEALR